MEYDNTLVSVKVTLVFEEAEFDAVVLYIGIVKSKQNRLKLKLRYC